VQSVLGFLSILTRIVLTLNCRGRVRDLKGQVELHLVYEGVRFERTYRADIIVENTVLLEIKSGDEFLPIHESQILTYLRSSGCHIGLLLNFNPVPMKHGLRRFVS
jgi:GxxExxY protein